MDVAAYGNRKDFGFPEQRHARFLRAGQCHGALSRQRRADAAGAPRERVRRGLHAGRGLPHRGPLVHDWSTLQLRLTRSERPAWAHRLSRIYTRTGDDGTTGLGDGSRVRKDHARVEAYGTVDEANSAIGVILAVPGLPAEVSRCLTEIQHDLFDLGGELCIPGTQVIKAERIVAARAGARPLQRPAARAQGFHPAGRRAGRRRLPPRAHHRAARRAARVDAGRSRSRSTSKCRSTSTASRTCCS